jgi:hypothetical protein
MVKDIHQNLGPKTFVPDDWEALILRVRAIWPDAWAEGSTGPERSWWTRDESAPDYDGIWALIGHSWPKKTGGYWLRLKMK